ncbi:hypothetical protein BFW01_g9390 [Lasiodiplodia theobromae]|uniref:Uncharacterized protein n=1 Tax=Lasiodiplodia theobromae TaxID=45133 RepID=A0A5N5DJG5_9PEZI|nr:uncharacterized protein LTHEOB_11161 [Lasiodiplodia theobromae]KAB2578015.1 hypothetical protein DBV05_g3428 [Lasiodiplodia theobromae]KAF4538036.1 hypothetical protein LTHEOB_11161 [Lasiodiplodia theobromae]KAF9638493.1 hypothetical protein BFW01_g9390 [Lasiodiplodia theobromae]
MADFKQQPPAYQEEADKLPEVQSHAVELPSHGEPSRSRSSTMRNIHKPIVIPQTINMFYVRSFSPFARAYAPALADLPNPISQDEFLAFIDGLNDAFMMHPFFQAGFMAGGMVMSAPILPVQIAGGGLQALAALGSGAVTLLRAKQFLKRANADIFNPRGLAVRTCTTKRMMQAVGRGDETRLTLPPLEDVDDLVHGLTQTTTTTSSDGGRPPLHSRTPSTTSAASGSASAQEGGVPMEDPRMRRLRALEGSVTPVTFDVPPAPLPRGALKRYSTAPTRWMNGRNVRALTTAREKGLRERREKAAQLDDELTAANREIEELERLAAAQEVVEEQYVANQQRAAVRPAGHQRMASQDLAVSLEKRAQIIEEIKKAGEKKIKKSDKKEERIANRILWIVITTTENAPPEDDEALSELADESSH